MTAKCHRFIMISMIFCDSQDLFLTYLRSRGWLSFSSRQAMSTILRKKQLRVVAVRGLRLEFGATGATGGAWTVFGEKFVLTTKAIVDSSFKTLGMCHLKVFDKLRDLI